MVKGIWSCFLGLILAVSLNAQNSDWSKHVPLVSKGTLSRDFTGNWSYPEVEKDKQKKYFEYCLHGLFRSGKVITGDFVGNYVLELYKELQKRDGTLRNDIRIYILRIPESVFLVSPKGQIFISIGAIARCQHPREIAYLIGKAYYFIEKKQYPENFSIPLTDKVGGQDYRDISLTPLFYSGISKDQQKNAIIYACEKSSKLGLNVSLILSRYKKLTMDPSGVEVDQSGIQKLLPWLFDGTTLMDSNMILKPKDGGFSIENIYESDIISEKVGTLQNENGQDLDSTGFEDVRRVALAESARLALLKSESFTALIWALKGYSDTKHPLFQWLGQLSILQIIRSSPLPRISFVHLQAWNKIAFYPSAQNIASSLNVIGSHPLNLIISVFKGAKELQKSPGWYNQALQIQQTLTQILRSEYEWDYAFVSNHAKYLESAQILPIEMEPLSKYSRFERPRYISAPNPQIWNWVDAWKNDSTFMTMWLPGEKKIPLTKGKIVLFTPVYADLTIRGRSLSLKPERNEAKLLWLEDEVRELAGAQQWNYRRLNGWGLRSGDVLLLNQIALISDFFQELSELGGNVWVTQEEVQKFSKENGISKILDYSVIRFTGLPSGRVEDADGIDMEGFPPIPIIAGITGIRMLSQAKETWIKIKIIDLQKPSVIYHQEKQISTNDRPDLVAGHLYNLMYEAPGVR